jgi:hypothetical protein
MLDQVELNARQWLTAPLSKLLERQVEGQRLGNIHDCLTDTPRYWRETTMPCAIAYDYARIRRLVRFGGELYCGPVADESAIGFDRPLNIKARQRSARVQALSASCRGGCAWDTFGCAGFLDVRSVNPRTAATLFV